MAGKFDDDFLEIEDKKANKYNCNRKLVDTEKEFMIDVENYDFQQFESEGICHNFLSEFNKCKNQKNFFLKYHIFFPNLSIQQVILLSSR